MLATYAILLILVGNDRFLSFFLVNNPNRAAIENKVVTGVNRDWDMEIP